MKKRDRRADAADRSPTYRTQKISAKGRVTIHAIHASGFRLPHPGRSRLGSSTSNRTSSSPAPPRVGVAAQAAAEK
jgi:hypothetical protein